MDLSCKWPSDSSSRDAWLPERRSMDETLVHCPACPSASPACGTACHRSPDDSGPFMPATMGKKFAGDTGVGSGVPKRRGKGQGPNTPNTGACIVVYLEHTL